MGLSLQFAVDELLLDLEFLSLSKIRLDLSKHNFERVFGKKVLFPYFHKASHEILPIRWCNSSAHFSHNSLIPIYIHNDIRNSWLALVEMKFFF
jgi:hypothetical protein